ncbi:hypothetical protein KBW81_12860 [Loktanella salsilacus]|uniref:hypothetical protein n=1 Tax=Loktanella salsilacus TaxID=195913 RepID=UPI0020B8196B|nr:hypothetical protein [Loktanella salsilacus]UTH47596.1 hypothetical protein KBW81_12860 [Loktanella salsilacus]
MDIDAIERENDREFNNLETQFELDRAADIKLLNCQAISASSLAVAGIPLNEWRLGIHNAELKLSICRDIREVERVYVKDLLDLGRRYAVSRYSKREGLLFSSALTATFPHGIKALLYQFLDNIFFSNKLSNRRKVQVALEQASAADDLPAYYKVGIVRAAIYDIANESLGSLGCLSLDKHLMRSILSLVRLYFSICEVNIQTINELDHVGGLYESARAKVISESSNIQPISGRFIKNWELRHLHPLTYYYPISIRNSLTRASIENGASTGADRSIILNEMALVRCELDVMRRVSKGSRSQ